MITRQVRPNDHTFVLFDSLKMGNLMTTVLRSQNPSLSLGLVDSNFTRKITPGRLEHSGRPAKGG